VTWFKVDDTLAAHPKVNRAGLAAMGLWVLAGSWSSQQLTDGYVPLWFVTRLEGGRRAADRLVKVGLWHEVVNEDGELGFTFHEWEQANPTRDAVVTRREMARERVARWRTNGARTNSPTRPDP